MRIILSVTVIALVSFGCSTFRKEADTSVDTRGARPRIEYTSAQLLMMNSDQIRALIKNKIAAAIEKPDDTSEAPDEDSVARLKEGLKIVLGRSSDQEGIRAPLFLGLRRELQSFDAIESTLEELALEGIAALQDGSSDPDIQVTYIAILENMMAELKPEIPANPKIKSIFETIRDANLKVPSKATSKELLRTMRVPVSPSETAKKILGPKT